MYSSLIHHAGSENSGLKGEIKQLIWGRKWLLPVPSELKSAYERQRLDDFGRLVVIGSPLLFLMYVGMNAFSYFIYNNVLVGDDRIVYLATEFLSGVILFGSLFIVRRPAIQKQFNSWVPVAAGLLIACKIIGGLLMDSQELAINQVYITVAIIIVATLALQTSAMASLATCVIASSGFIAAAYAADDNYVALFVYYYLMTCLICMFIAGLAEDQYRMSFLKSVLLEYEASEIQRLNEVLEKMARQDSLTGLPNRRSFDEALLREWERARREKTAVAVLLLDIDFFKTYNDTYGHPAGDECLATVARSLAGTMRRSGDMVARYGGEEFVVILPNTDRSGAEDVARRLIAAVDGLFMAHAGSAISDYVTISVGVAIAMSEVNVSYKRIIDDADAALYEAKKSGRHQYSMAS